MITSVATSETGLVQDVLLYGAHATITIDFSGQFRLFDDIKHRDFDYTSLTTGPHWKIAIFETLAGLLRTHSLAYAEKCHYYTIRFIDEVVDLDKGSTIRISHIESWLRHLPLSAWPFVSPVLRRWAKTYPRYADPEVVSFLESPAKWDARSDAYLALVTNDPERGALTEQELRAVQNEVNGAYEDGSFSLMIWAFWWFFIATGVRPVQMARMTRSDVTFISGPEGLEAILLIPLAKGRDADKTKRWSRKASSVLAEVLRVYLEAFDAAGGVPSDPLFLPTSYDTILLFTSSRSMLCARSERLEGAFIHLFPYRFRYTMGTRAIAHGASDDEVARLLTHRSTSCISSYRAAMPQLQRPIADAIGLEMHAFARAFRGRLIDDLSQATRAGEGAALIRDFAQIFRMELGLPIGACGTKAECHQDAPRACLQCHKFEPFAGAPWEELLTSLRQDLATEAEPRIRLITQGMIDAVKDIISERDADRLEVSVQ